MTPVIDARRTPRVRTSTDAEIIVGKYRMPAVVRSASSTGLGIEVRGDQRGLLRNAMVRVSLTLYGRPVELPGKIVWRGGTDDADLGVRLQLEITSQAWRNSYALWVAQLGTTKPQRPTTSI